MCPRVQRGGPDRDDPTSNARERRDAAHDAGGDKRRADAEHDSDDHRLVARILERAIPPPRRFDYLETDAQDKKRRSKYRAEPDVHGRILARVILRTGDAC